MADEQQPEVVILGTDGTEHHFPPGFDPKRAASIVRASEASTTGPQQPPTPAATPAPTTNLDRLAALAGRHVSPQITDAAKAIDELGAKQTARDETWAADTASKLPPSLQFPVGAGLSLIKPALEIGSVFTGAPVARAVNNAVPNTARAGRAFENVMASAKDVPVDTAAPGNVALRIQELADRGGSMPMAVRKLLNRMTNPDQGDLTYKEARDFASNISRLSADEYGRLTPVVAREVASLRVALNQSIANAAAKVGKGEEYLSAMSEYARAAKLREALNSAYEGAKKALPAGLVGGAGYWMTKKVRDLLGE